MENEASFRERMAKEQEDLDRLFGTLEGLNGTLEKILRDKQLKKWRKLCKGVQIG